MKVIFSSEARRDLGEIGDHIGRHSHEAAARFLEVLHGRCLGLSRRPERFRIVYRLDPPVRQIVEGRYRILYSVRQDHVWIERVVASARQIDETGFKR